MRRYEIAKSLFVQALHLPADERAAFIARAVGADGELRREVEELLAFHVDSLGGSDEVPIREERPASIGPWRIESELGRGGIGVVYLARRGDEPPIALKVLRGGLLSADLVSRFRREAAVLARLDHPGIARALETGVDDGPIGPRPWIAMEYVEGPNLRSWAAVHSDHSGRLELMARVCDTVQHAHAHGVVHRDLKPENILVRTNGQPVVLDFGVARLVDSDVRATTLHTQVGVLIGTIRYMSPEQADARPDTIGPRSDVHQLAAITYELVTGRLPYEVPEDSVHRALVAVLTAPTRPMDELPPKVRRPLERVLRAALAKNPARRLESASLLAEDLRRVAAGRSPLARPAREGGVDGWRLAAGAAAVAAFGVALAWFLGGIGPAPSPLDRVMAAVRPAYIFDRSMLDADSMTVRLHYNTRTLERLREARTYGEHSLALLGTERSQPWYPQARAHVTFRLGEALYLIAERTYDAELYRAAAETWYSSRETTRPPVRVAMPDTLGYAAHGSILPTGTEAWGAAGMAWDDLARIAHTEEAHQRAARVREEGVRVFLAPFGASSLLTMRLPERRDERTAMAGWLQGMGASYSNRGFDAGDTVEVREGLAYLRRAAAIREIRGEGSMYASVLHDLGAAFLRTARLTGADSLLDSAFVRLGAARDLRVELPGYTSVVHSSRELAQAHRLAAWWAADSATRERHLRMALRLLQPPTGEAELGKADLAVLAIGRSEVLTDLACVRRDTVQIRLAEREIREVWRNLSREQVPRLAIEADLQRIRQCALRFAVTGSQAHMTRIRQILERVSMHADASTARERSLLAVAAGTVGEVEPRKFDLRYPVPEPF